MPRPFFRRLLVNLMGVAEVRTLKLDFMVKKWQNQKIIFGILIYALCRLQNHKNPVGRIDTLIRLQTTQPWLFCYINCKLSLVNQVIGLFIVVA